MAGLRSEPLSAAVPLDQQILPGKPTLDRPKMPDGRMCLNGVEWISERGLRDIIPLALIRNVGAATWVAG